METNKIYFGDAYELIKQIPDKSIDLIYTDPPYDFHSGTAVSGGIFKDRECKPHQDVVDAKLNAGIDNSILDEFVRILKHIYIYMVQQVSNSVLSKLLLILSKYKFRDSNMAQEKSITDYKKHILTRYRILPYVSRKGCVSIK